jgi:hypothetical protein
MIFRCVVASALQISEFMTNPPPQIHKTASMQCRLCDGSTELQLASRFDLHQNSAAGSRLACAK